MKNYYVINFLAFFLPLLASCTKKDVFVEQPKPETSNVVILEGEIDTERMLSNDSVYIVKGILTIGDGGSLSIEAGTIIKFDKLAGFEGGFVEPFIAVGTEDAPIIFTSIKDDIGGDTNGDGSVSSPEPGDWKGIHLHGNGGHLKHCRILYGGNKSTFGALCLSSGEPVIIENCTFANNSGRSIDDNYPQVCGAIRADMAYGNAIIRNNIFYKNLIPFTTNLNTSFDDSNVFHNPENPEEKNSLNCIFVTGNSDPGTTKWEETEVAFVMWTMVLYDGFQLELGDNVVLKFITESTKLGLTNSSGQLINYNGNGVYFTSFADDSLKGDSNGDGGLTSPDDFKWEGVYDETTDSFLNWSNILYAKN